MHPCGKGGQQHLGLHCEGHFEFLQSIKRFDYSVLLRAGEIRLGCCGPPPHLTAQSPIPPGLGHLQGWGICSKTHAADGTSLLNAKLSYTTDTRLGATRKRGLLSYPMFPAKHESTLKLIRLKQCYSAFLLSNPNWCYRGKYTCRKAAKPRWMEFGNLFMLYVLWKSVLNQLGDIWGWGGGGDVHATPEGSLRKSGCC